MKRNLIIGGVALGLLLISIKFFPYHCNCHPPVVGVVPVATSTAAASSTALLPASTRTAEVYLNPTVVIDGAVFKVDVADTEALREQGLSGRPALCDRCGMLFVFPSASEPGFWMKDMNFALDIVWISPDKKIIGVEKSLAPSTYPKVYFPTAPVEYVLELPAGTFNKDNFKTGDAVEMHL